MKKFIRFIVFGFVCSCCEVIEGQYITDSINPIDTTTSNYVKNETISMPIAHKQGNYYANSELLAQLKDNNQIAFKYTNNPNGSCDDIAGIFNEKKNILGMMPHPERAAENILGSKDGIKIFESMISKI